MPFAISPRAIKRLHHLIWTLIFAGLLALVLGVATLRQPDGDAVGTLLAAGGALAAAVGVVLIWLHSRLREAD
ncbi:hypothetical protein [Xylophilus sp.]|uniref:hypothetical protein n=1 Tax=Xylophilus sp. TaxID=2653893 RepID=UPI0013BC8EF8|nr:hypothetical protein [Xylophilus sp.]KAF1048744.1 MAG: hypothetical protein GAK38_01188 [Xylophilus sp.]